MDIKAIISVGEHMCIGTSQGRRRGVKLCFFKGIKLDVKSVYGFLHSLKHGTCSASDLKYARSL